MKNIIRLQIEETLIKEYTKGRSCASLGREYKIGHTTIARYLRSKGIEVVNKQNEQIGLKKDIFKDIDSEEKAYWLGFLYADGSVSERGSISLCLKESDLSHIEKFKKFTGSSNKISYRIKQKAYRFDFKCKEIKEDLCRLGCVPNKTWVISDIPDIPYELKRHFFRGYFDGDGCISFANERADGSCLPSISIVSNTTILTNFCKYLDSPRSLTPKAGTAVCAIRWSGTKAVGILNFMYENCSVYLDRKYTRYTIFKKKGFAAQKSDFPSY